MTTIGQRKADHLALCATDEVAFRDKTTLFEQVRFVHDALPDLDEGALDTSCTILGKRLRAPIVLGNLGVVQAREMSTADVASLAKGIGADALCIHLNPAMELVQPGGDRDFRGGLETIARLVRELPLPVVVKETGCGLSRSVGERLASVGVRHVDTSGAGGTSWVAVETKRAEAAQDHAARALGEALWDWGIPTAASVGMLAPLGFETIIATGGVATGLDVARAVALGASAAGIARPMLKALKAGGRDQAVALLDGILAELRAVMLLTGSADVAALRQAPRLLGAELRQWASAR